MLHGFDATSSSSGGAETVAFIPAGSFTTQDGVSRLAHYAEQDYGSQVHPHRYFVDGEITAADVYTSGTWQPTLVGTLERGGRRVYAFAVKTTSTVKFLRGITNAYNP